MGSLVVRSPLTPLGTGQCSKSWARFLAQDALPTRAGATQGLLGYTPSPRGGGWPPSCSRACRLPDRGLTSGADGAVPGGPGVASAWPGRGFAVQSHQALQGRPVSTSSSWFCGQGGLRCPLRTARGGGLPSSAGQTQAWLDLGRGRPVRCHHGDGRAGEGKRRGRVHLPPPEVLHRPCRQPCCFLCSPVEEETGSLP